MMGVLALVAVAYIATSCSRDEVSGSILEAKQQAFESSFIAEYGTPDAQQAWGFDTGMGLMPNTKGVTRGNTGDNYPATSTGINANANEWADPNKYFGGWLVPDPLTEGQKLRVRKYFQANPNLGHQDPHWRHFFVQQVYKGNPETAGKNSTEEVVAADGSKYTSDNMNHLTVGQNHQHINNFNSGTCSTNNDVLDNGGNVNNGPYHSDQIMLMVNIDDTSCFGYHDSGSSNQSNDAPNHNDKWALVSAATIDAWASQNGNPGEAVVDKWNRSFMGFDLALKEGAQAQSDVTVKYNDGPESYSYAKINNEIVAINGNDNIVFNGRTINYLTTNKNFYVAADFMTLSDGQIQSEYRVNGQYMGKYLNVDYIMTLLGEGWLPVQDKNLREWVKIGVSDGYFSDWIVTLTEAQRLSGGHPAFTQKKTVLLEQGRVFCEDLGSSERSDIDYNDIVFDARIYAEITEKKEWDESIDGYGDWEQVSSEIKPAEIVVLAAGGQLNAQIAGRNVHDMFGTGLGGVMLNTYREGVTQIGGSAHEEDLPVYRFYTDASYSKIIDIPVVVRVNKEVVELTAVKGAVPQKICGPIGARWPAERVGIDLAYPGFADWVKGSKSPWSDINRDYLYQSDHDYVIYSWIGAFGGGSNGGTITAVGTDSKVEAAQITLAGKNTQYTATYEKNGEQRSYGYVDIEFDRPLAAGDKIAMSANRNSDDEAKVSAPYIAFYQGETLKGQINDTEGGKRFNLKSANPNEYVYDVPAEAAGSTKIRLTRATGNASTSLLIKSLVITRESLLSSVSEDNQVIVEEPVETTNETSDEGQTDENEENFVLWSGTLALGNAVDIDVALPSGGAVAGQTLTFYFVHTHNQWNTGHFRAISLDGWSTTYIGYTQGLKTETSLSVILTDEMVQKLNADQKVKVDGQGMDLIKITLE
jgi:hypothetical protein